MQAILFSMMTLCLVYQLGRRWFGGRRYGWFAMVALGVSALFFIYALEIRPYAFAMLLTSLSMLNFQRWLKERTRSAAIGYALTVAALLYVHYFLLIFIMAQVIYFLLQRPTRALLRQAVGVMLLIFVIWLPWFPFFLTQFEHIRTVELASDMARGVAGSSVTTQPTSLDSIVKLIQLATNGQFILYAIVLLVGLIYGGRKTNYRLALSWAIGVPALAFTLNTVVAVYSQRYIVNFIIGLALILAFGMVALPGRLRWGGLAVFAGLSLWGLPAQLPQDVVPYNVLFDRLAAASQPGDIIFFDKGGYNGDVMPWQMAHHLPEPLRTDFTQKVDEALPTRRIWHITSQWFSPDVQANFARIEETHPLQTVIGRCDSNWCYLIQLLEAPPWNEPKVFGEDMAFWGADVDAATLGAIQTRLWWKVEHAPSIDYSMSLRLLDSNGTLVAQADGPVNHYNTIVNTSQFEPRHIYIDSRMLNLPPGLPPGTYTLELVVYNWQTNERLTLPDGSDHLHLEILNIPAP
jgi:hypothetical protein